MIEVLIKILIVYYHLYFPLFLCRQSLYDNREDIQERFSLFWERVAKRFASNSYVLGYELLNEPWAGDIYQFPDQVEPRKCVVYLF